MALDQGDLTGLWYPAIGAKDVALALEENHIDRNTGSSAAEDGERGQAIDDGRVADRRCRRSRQQGAAAAVVSGVLRGDRGHRVSLWKPVDDSAARSERASSSRWRSLSSLVIGTQHTDAHTPVTSKYDYNKDVFPLLRDHCALCHVPDGPAPMSLMTYGAAMPWAQSIRDELTAGRMPPWPVDPTSPPVKGAHPISSHDVDVIVVWAAGGTPEGNLDAKLPKVTFNPQWKLGPPDLKLQMDAEHTVAPSAIEEVRDFSLPTNLTETKWVKAADLMPGTASIVRDAVISIENGPVLSLWQPGSDTTAAPSGTAFRLAPGSKIHLQIHYKKHFDQEQNAVSDRSTIGLYFTDPPPSGGELQSFAIDPPEAAGSPSGAVTFGSALPKAARIVALRPMLDRAYESLSVDAITPSGAEVPAIAATRAEATVVRAVLAAGARGTRERQPGSQCASPPSPTIQTSRR